jgi:hypothetical protein
MQGLYFQSYNVHILKWLGREADHSPSTSAEVKKLQIYMSTPSYIVLNYLS